jgi:hypothetical protein
MIFLCPTVFGLTLARSRALPSIKTRFLGLARPSGQQTFKACSGQHFLDLGTIVAGSGSVRVRVAFDNKMFWQLVP